MGHWLQNILTDTPRLERQEYFHPGDSVVFPLDSSPPALQTLRAVLRVQQSPVWQEARRPSLHPQGRGCLRAMNQICWYNTAAVAPTALFQPCSHGAPLMPHECLRLMPLMKFSSPTEKKTVLLYASTHYFALVICFRGSWQPLHFITKPVSRARWKIGHLHYKIVVFQELLQTKALCQMHLDEIN